MMPKRSRLCAAALGMAVAFCSANVRAEATLKAGDDAPKLAVAKFVKGEPVKEFEKGKIYVVEFWATWCPPCRESIPHLSEMQKAMPDVTFIGSDVGEDEAKVMPFVTQMGDKMNYRVTLDDMSKEGGATNAAYMEAAGQNGIPTAFIVDKDSKIAWIGHPMEMEPVLKQVVAGTFDLKKSAAAGEAKANLVEMLNKSDFDGALKASDAMIAADPTMASELGMLQFQVLLQGKKDPAAAAKKAEALAPKIEDAQQLNALAWGLVTAEKTTPESLDAAQKIAEMAVKKSDNDAQIVDTLARVHAVKKDFPKAVELQTMAVAKCTDAAMKPELQKTLDAYKAGTVPAAE